jgi:hypothetical protein
MDFDAYYFAHSCGLPYRRDEHWLSFFDRIAARIVSDIGPGTVLDAGCAMGFLVEKLRARNVQAWGVDISDYAIQQVHPDIQPYCQVGSITDPFPQSYDLIVCIEVLEHMPREQAEVAVENFCAHSDNILFSSTPFDYKEATHLNVQPPEYWASLFARQGFFRDVDFDGAFITPWAVRYQRLELTTTRLIQSYERKFWPLMKENADLRQLIVEMRNQLAAQEAQLEVLHEQVAESTRRVQMLEAQIAEIFASRSWRFLQILQNLRLRLIPAGSRLEKLLLRK